MSFIAIVPARLASTRLPNKALIDLGGKPMVVRTAQQASYSQANRIIVATDSPEIMEAVKAEGFEAVLTSPDHPTGTDRLAEVVATLGLAPDEIVVNVQGDEPLIEPELINQVALSLRQSSEASIATMAVPIHDAETLFNPNIVKVVLNRSQYALYFSRAPIPWARDALADGKQRLAHKLPALQHIGLYAYRVNFLHRFPTLERGILESVESLEQLRALENGFTIAVSVSPNPPAPGVDTLEDLARVREIFVNRL
ncbi:3-deoxy-manno-octulosonate cytidylyltransferase [Paenalcaligenes niemegkensis]|uniref:3-deoxy-manno-octulosonate cytidylyltransferase n=1 Tax=Paenalcaligenes niemegkensis TaxID=2895469 RepID=UPI001EE78A91|nr:3-deoxy-manno-octulosonate cytidylyltransferase [Paenalcaligenes niemegkensis]MCQ9616620.1 3-deoxy-manno-octulosonate cytidylyltransferase [Paenalcaligenes niemegkensis]